MVKLIADEQAAIEQRHGLIGLPLSPVGSAQRDIDPRLRVVVGLRGAADQSLGSLVERCAFARKFA